MIDSTFLKHLFSMIHSENMLPEPNQLIPTSAGEWWKAHFKLVDGFECDLDKLVFLAFVSDNLSCAFNVAYQFALRATFTEVFEEDFKLNSLACLCVSEQGGNSPKAIQCLANHEGISGLKTFVTCAPEVDHLLVMFDDKRNMIHGEKQDSIKNLRLLKISHFSRKDPSIEITLSPPAKFLPEIEKGYLKLDKFIFKDEDILPGNAHEQYSKPFSVTEGLFIRLASVSILLRFAQAFELEKDLVAELLGQLKLLYQLALTPNEPINQLIIHAQAQKLEQLLPYFDQAFERQGGMTYQFWQRDKVLFFMDTPMRLRRFDNAWNDIMKS